MLHIKIPVIVEGRYDKSHLSSIISGHIITTDGFGIFRNAEKRALIQKLGKNGIILLCDSDGGGKIIRSHLKGQLVGIKTYDLYIPQIEGKERRKAKASKAGYLGVEGVPAAVLRKVFDDFAAAHPELVQPELVQPELVHQEPVDGGEAPAEKRNEVRRSLMYELGLSGGNDAQKKRDELCRKLGLPAGMNANALYSAVNMISDEEEVKTLMGKGK